MMESPPPPSPLSPPRNKLLRGEMIPRARSGRGGEGERGRALLADMAHMKNGLFPLPPAAAAAADDMRSKLISGLKVSGREGHQGQLCDAQGPLADEMR